jgi:hypothetical protein
MTCSRLHPLGRDATPAAPVAARRRRLLLLTFAAIVAAPAAPRAAPARRGRVGFANPGLPGRGPYGSGILDQNDLERCVKMEGEINAGAAAIDTEEASVNARRGELERLTREIEQSAARVDRSSPAAVSRHNKLVEQQRTAANEFNAGLPAFNARVERHNKRMDAFDSGCAAHRFYEADMRAVRARLMLD